MSYDHEYVEYDELSAGPVPLGPRCIRCQCCGKVVITRHYVDLKINSDPPRTEKVLAMVRLSHYRRVPLALNDGSYIGLHMCSMCATNESFDYEKDEEKCAKVVNQIKHSFMNEDRFHLKHEDDVQEKAKSWDKLKAIRSFQAMGKDGLSQKEVVEKTKDAAKEFEIKNLSKHDASEVRH